jgi:MoaA/NifB/PqqE/SkfB family radical SAM enzyme
MPLPLYRRLLSELRDPEILRLNYSGESTHHPQIVAAIELAAATGAWVELVAVPAALAPQRLAAIIEAGLNRLTVSLHTLDAAQFAALYGFGNLTQMLANLRRAAQLRQHVRQPFVLDLAFVATADTLAQLPRVAALAAELALPVLAVHPVIRRVAIPEPYATELDAAGALRPEFRAELAAVLATVRASHPQIALQVSTPEVGGVPDVAISGEPASWPGALPPGALLHSCDQDPFETLHILADGRVVTCEVRDAVTVGDLTVSSLAAIWHGPTMRDFRAAFVAGRDPHCRTCVYKRAYRPQPQRARLTARMTAGQLLYGWHAPDATVVWSKREAMLTLARGAHATALHLDGVLPPGSNGSNVLAVDVDDQRCAQIVNGGSQSLAFQRRIPLPPAAGAASVTVRLHTAQAFRPANHGGSDVRELGFALAAAAID